MPIFDHDVRTSHGRLHVIESSGPGLPIVLLHGSGASGHVFSQQLASDLSERHRLIVPDLPGHGGSDDAREPGRTYSLPGFTSAVVELLSGLGVDCALVCGWSLGGHIGIELMSRWHGIAGLMISGTPPMGRGPLGMLTAFHPRFDLLLASKPQFSDRDVQRYAHLCYGDHADRALLDAIRRTDGRARTEFTRSLMRGDGSDQRRTVQTSRVPLAVVNGEHDPLVRLSYVAGLHYATLWWGVSQVVANAGHAPFWDQPEAYNLLLSSFAVDVVAQRATAPVGQKTSARLSSRGSY